MKSLLVSFCNVKPPDFVLGAYEFENDCFQWIKLAPSVTDCLGATGIAVANGHYWVVWQAERSSIIKLNSDFKVDAVYPLPISRDAHSILPCDGGFLIADTQRNCVNIARVPGNGRPVIESELWRQCNINDKDQLHINSVCSLNGEIYVSCFGDRPENGWQSSQSGKIININTGEVVCDNLQHPHTLVSRSGAVYWLESKTGLVHKYTPGEGHETLMKLDGYVRGLAFDGDLMYVGASALRRHSRSMGTANKIISDNPDDFYCWIYRVSLGAGKIDRRNLTAYGNEIYDLFLAHDAPLEISRASSGYAVTDRLWRIEDDCHAHNDKLQQALIACQDELRRCKPALDGRAEATSGGSRRIRAELERIYGTVRRRTCAIAGGFLGKLLR
jgi:hypothetical protein